MRLTKYLLTILLFNLPFFVKAQMLHGHVYEMQDGRKSPLPGASLHWDGTGIGTTTDVDGHFMLAKPDSMAAPCRLIIMAVGHDNDTLLVNKETELDIVMKNDYELKTVVVAKEQKGSYISRINVAQQEVIGQKQLLKAACCNLSESFETNPSVDVNFSDAISGAKQIRLLGLQGIYSQMLLENMPGLRGLASTYGLSYVPGTWIESIQVTKGAGSVVNGYESMAGQINLELIKPMNPEKLYFNAYGDQMGRSELNLNLAHQFNERLSSALLTHADGIFMRVDNNKDGFLDNPLTRQLSFMNRWNYTDNKRLESQFGISGLWQNRFGGQMDFRPELHKGGTQYYGLGVNTRRLEAFGKLGIVFPEKPYKSIGSQYEFVRHSQDAYFGLRNYQGDENMGYANFIYQSIIGNTNHKFKTGASFLYDGYRESFMDSAFNRDEVVPGIFGEYSYSYTDKLSLQAGLRLDYHNLYGLMTTPRLHLRYTPMKHTVLRASIGKGYRTPNIWVENASVWASSRKIVIAEKIGQESSWNYGISLLQDFKLKKREGNFSADLFHTEFLNQAVIDLDQDPHQVVISNLHGRSFANSFQAGLTYELIKKLDVTLAYKYYDVQTTYHGTLMDKPLVPKQRMMITTSYSTKYDKWMFDFTAMRYGQSRLPNMSGTDENYQAQYSPAYNLFNLQLTRNFKHWSIYAGSENALNYKQPNPIVAVDQPFGPNFDASMIWGPIEGRRIYLGLRYKVK